MDNQTMLTMLQILFGIAIVGVWLTWLTNDPD